MEALSWAYTFVALGVTGAFLVYTVSTAWALLRPPRRSPMTAREIIERG